MTSIIDRLATCKGLLEIGPGPGVLTGPLSERAIEMIALEIDPRMIELLSESAPRADVRAVDALRTPLSDLLHALTRPRGVVSNLPYYITGPLLQRLAEVRNHFDIAVLMMQREVADRVLAPPGNSGRGSLSVFLQSQFDISLVRQVPPGSFLPPPKVSSTVLQFLPKADDLGARFFRLVRLAFAQPRKTLVNNLVAGYGIDRETAADWARACHGNVQARPSDLDINEWICLSRLTPGS